MELEACQRVPEFHSPREHSLIQAYQNFSLQLCLYLVVCNEEYPVVASRSICKPWVRGVRNALISKLTIAVRSEYSIRPWGHSVPRSLRLRSVCFWSYRPESLLRQGVADTAAIVLAIA